MLRKNFSIKIISVLLAVFLWLFVTNNDNPQDVKKLSVPINVINENSLASRGIFLRNNNYQRNVVLNVRGRREKIKNISEADFEITLDFSKIKDSRVTRLAIDPVKYIGTDVSIDEISIEYLSPLEVDLSLEKIDEKSFSVQLSTTGNPKESYKAVKTVITPDKIILRGLESIINTVDSIKTSVDLKDIDRNLSVKKTCKVYNKSGREITGLSGNLDITVDVDVAREVPLQVVTRGKPAKNYIDGNRTVKPDKILIAGAPDIINNIDYLNTEPVNIENASKNISKASAIKLPEGVSIYGDNKKVTVSIEIQQLSEKDISINIADIAFSNMETDNSLKYSVLLQPVSVKIQGIGQQLDSLNPANLNPTIDVAGLGEGTYKLPLKVVLPEVVRLVQDTLVDIKIEKR
jgi:YbbR domain-containing protein